MHTSSGVTISLLNTRIISLENKPNVEFNSLINDTLILGKVSYTPCCKTKYFRNKIENIIKISMTSLVQETSRYTVFSTSI